MRAPFAKARQGDGGIEPHNSRGCAQQGRVDVAKPDKIPSTANCPPATTSPCAFSNSAVKGLGELTKRSPWACRYDRGDPRQAPTVYASCSASAVITSTVRDIVQAGAHHDSSVVHAPHTSPLQGTIQSWRLHFRLPGQWQPA